MKLVWFTLVAVVVSITVAYLVYRGVRPQVLPPVGAPTDGSPMAGDLPALQVGIIPERDIFAQRQRYRALADYLESQLGRSIELVTVSTYRGILEELATHRVDVAFLGSLVAVLAMDKLDCRVLVKPELPGGVTTYHGVLFVRADSPIQAVSQLAGKSIAMVQTTTAGDVFPMHQMQQMGLLGRSDAPRVVWVGTHDEVVLGVAEGSVDAGSAKDLRLTAWEQAHPDRPMRHLAEGAPVPNNALLVRSDLAAQLGQKLRRVMLNMHESTDGQAALSAFGAERFVPCQAEEYEPIRTMMTDLGTAWQRAEVTAPIVGAAVRN